MGILRAGHHCLWFFLHEMPSDWIIVELHMTVMLISTTSILCRTVGHCGQFNENDNNSKLIDGPRSKFMKMVVEYSRMAFYKRIIETRPESS